MEPQMMSTFDIIAVRLFEPLVITLLTLIAWGGRQTLKWLQKIHAENLKAHEEICKQVNAHEMRLQKAEIRLEHLERE